MIESILKFIKYWYFRYLLVTELYMVEKWERIMIHIVFLLFFTVISVFNWKVVLGITSLLSDAVFGYPSQVDFHPDVHT